MLIFVYLSLPFLVVAGVLYVIGRLQGGPWDSLGYFYFAMLALVAWAGATFIYCIYLLIANGLVAGNILPGLFVAAVVVVAGVWGWNSFRDDRACTYAMSFYEQLAAAEPGAQLALIAANRKVVAEPSQCRLEALFYWFGHDKFDPDARGPDGEAARLATLDLLLQKGLPPDDAVVWRAVNDTDARLFDLLMARRAELNRAGDRTWDPAPASVAFNATDQIELDTSSVYYAFTPAYRAILETLMAGGVDLCARDPFDKTLGERLATKGLIQSGEIPACT
jgi:hypothetical protein